ncbi:hypothetical protein DCAR_0312005 [Daucus carota subsp. sativus]|uniref:Uncharacterized protein n=1 Tax=Daucus carota subsp. sativus TaxID=79200 RepID=A0AAF1AUH5_DAUCS|nr:PREDICTED: cytochrome c1-like [Daucus carota subsp. sativus]WOG92730.1 hypothetical protein DCAR_0312005 [Daucus carota subsp. sativus]
MGGCASRPKDLALEAKVPVEDPAKTVPEPVAETVPQESNAGEEKKEEPLIDVSAPADEAPKVEEVKTAEPETTPEVTTEDKPAEPKEEAAVKKVEEPAKTEEVAPKSEDKSEAVPTPVV